MITPSNPSAAIAPKVVIAVPIAPPITKDEVVILEAPNAITSHIAQYEVLVVEVSVAMADPVAKNNVPDSITTRSAAVPTTFAGVVAVSKLGALAIVQRQVS
jgi:hypothetical protein